MEEKERREEEEWIEIVREDPWVTLKAQIRSSEREGKETSEETPILGRDC